MLKKTGIPAEADLDKALPSRERLEEGPVAVFECFEEIPCDPCYYSCPVEAVDEFEDINELPELDSEACTGCGRCIAACPGLAAFVLDFTYSEDKGLIGLPYEFTPLPQEGEEVIALDHAGEKTARAEVVRVNTYRGSQKTPVVWLAVEKNRLARTRHFRRLKEDEE